MINKNLETNVNKERLLENLAQNLNINFITEGSNLKRLVDIYVAENQVYANNVDQAIANGFLSTMTTEFLELFGSQHNIYRKNYSTISTYYEQEAILLRVDKDTTLVNTMDTTFSIFKKGDTIYSDENIVIESLEDIFFSDINEVQYISVRVSLTNGSDSYTITEGSSFIVNSTNTATNLYYPSFVLQVERAIGLAFLQESEEDYRLRIQEATYIANNGANSLVSSITKEVPFIKYLEVNDYTQNRAIKTLYPYTQVLIDNGEDYFLESIILPLIETNIQNKILYGQLVEVKKPEALLLNITIKTTKNISDYALSNFRTTFNNFYATNKSFTKESINNYIRSELNLLTTEIEYIKYAFTSPYVSEETFEYEAETLEIPLGRFLHLNNIRNDKTTIVE